MGYEIPTGDTNPEGGGGNWITEKCDVQFRVIDFIDRLSAEKPQLEFKLQVIASTVESQVGKIIDEKFAWTSKAVGRLLEFACAIGLYTKPQWKADREAGINADIDFTAATGRVGCAFVNLKPGTTNPNAKFAEIGFNIFGCGDEEAFHIPLDPDTVLDHPNGFVRKDGTLFKRGANPVPKQHGGSNDGGTAGNGAANKPKPPAPSGSKAPPSAANTASAFF